MLKKSKTIPRFLRGRQPGFALLIAILIVAILIIAGGAGYYSHTSYKVYREIKTPETVKPEQVVDETANWETYKNEKYGFEIQYPPQYLLKETLEDKSVVSFGTLKPSPATGKPFLSPYLVIWVLNNPRNYTLEEFYNFYSFRENEELMEAEVGKRVYPYYKESDSIEPREINGISAVKFWVGGYWRMTISIPYKDKIFEIHGGTEEEKIFNQTLSTFKFIK